MNYQEIDESGNEYFYDIKLTEEESKPFREKFTRRNICWCGCENIHKEPILGYNAHPDGVLIRNGKYWLYIHCQKCGYDWALWKLGGFKK